MIFTKICNHERSIYDHITRESVCVDCGNIINPFYKNSKKIEKKVCGRIPNPICIGAKAATASAKAVRDPAKRTRDIALAKYNAAKTATKNAKAKLAKAQKEERIALKRKQSSCGR